MLKKENDLLARMPAILLYRGSNFLEYDIVTKVAGRLENCILIVSVHAWGA